MKKIYYLILLFTSFQYGIAQVPNGGFESWTLGDPDNWGTSNIIPFGVPVTQTTPGHSGTYAAKGQPVILTSGDTLTALLSAGPSGGGFPVSQRYSTLEFYYKLNVVPGDQFSVVAVIYDASSAAIASGALYYVTNQSAFVKGSIPMIYFGGTPAASAAISIVMGSDFSTGRNYPSPSSYFIIDDVTFTGLVAGTKEVNPAGALRVFPVPAQDYLRIEGLVNHNKPIHLLLSDAAGRRMMERNSVLPVNNFIADELNLQRFAPGVYFLSLIGEEETTVRRIVIQ